MSLRAVTRRGPAATGSCDVDDSLVAARLGKIISPNQVLEHILVVPIRAYRPESSGAPSNRCDDAGRPD